MATRADIYKDINNEIDRNKLANKYHDDTNKELFYKQVPRVKEIDDALRLISLKITKEKIKSSFLENNETSKVMKSLQKERADLYIEREELYIEHKQIYYLLEPTYTCSICKDTGTINNEKCSCFIEKVLDRIYNQSNVKNVIKVENFENFNFDFYGDNIIYKNGLSSREIAKSNYNACLKYTDEFPNEKNLLIQGDTGLGKTYLCNCIAERLLSKRFAIIYLTAKQLFDKLEQQKFNKDDEDLEFSDYDRELLDVDLIIIDDLGTEFPTIFTASALFNLLNERLIAKKSTVISTNLSIEELRDQYSDRVVSRILGSFNFVNFIGKDIRMIKRFSANNN